MGYIRHHAIVVTGWDAAQLATAHEKADDLGMRPSAIIRSHMNGYETFLVPPDGSKEGWDESDDGDKSRKTFTRWMSEEAPYLAWVVVQYGDEERVTKIMEHSDE